MTRRRPPGVLAVFSGGAAAFGLVYVVFTTEVFSLDGARAVFEQATHPKAPHAPATQAAATSPEEMLLALPCFGCHSRQRFLDETSFGHRAHEAAGHCHVCHAFASHFEVTVRKEHCGSCHPTIER